jgi:carboxypeptidase C (cathepsin A)
MLVDGTEYGSVRQYGNFSFARIYEAGHEIPYYQRMSHSHLFFSLINCFANGSD